MSIIINVKLELPLHGDCYDIRETLVVEANVNSSDGNKLDDNILNKLNVDMPIVLDKISYAFTDAQDDKQIVDDNNVEEEEEEEKENDDLDECVCLNINNDEYKILLHILSLIKQKGDLTRNVLRNPNLIKIIPHNPYKYILNALHMYDSMVNVDMKSNVVLTYGVFWVNDAVFAVNKKVMVVVYNMKLNTILKSFRQHGIKKFKNVKKYIILNKIFSLITDNQLFNGWALYIKSPEMDRKLIKEGTQKIKMA